MIWFGEKRGYLTDWTTQLWVRATGKRLDVREYPWLDGPVGPPRGIGADFFRELARREKLDVRTGGAPLGIIPDFGDLRGETFDPREVSKGVIAFYEQTSAFDLEAWSQWCGAFRPFGSLLRTLFSRRLQQLNVPLSGLDTSRGVTNEVWHLVEPASGLRKYAVWVRHMVGSKDVLYAGSYTPCRVPGFDGVCLKVVFPLPNGNALVIMRPEAHPDGSLSLVSGGDSFGSPGFYFVVHGNDNLIWARYVRTMRESIRVYECDGREARADHTLRMWGLVFLRLHYRLRRRN